MKHLFNILIIVALLGQSCTTLKKCSAKFPPTIVIKDSLIYKDSIVIKDSLITVKGDEVYFNTYITDTLVFVDTVLQQGRTQLVIKYRNGKLTAICKTDSLQLLINTLKRQLITASFTKTVTQHMPIDRPVKYLPWYAKTAICICVLLIFLAAFYLWANNYFNNKK